MWKICVCVKRVLPAEFKIFSFSFESFGSREDKAHMIP